MDVRDLTGKTALVTGAASGIGRETALALARRGAALAICDVNESGLKETADSITALGRKVATYRVDVARRDEMRDLAESVHRDVEAVDILMNNAGVGLGASLLDTTLEDWDWIVGINLMGVIYGCHFFVPPMVSRGKGGHVINVSSAAGYVASEMLNAYSTTKFGVLGFSEALADELRRSDVGVTAVCPGLINTPIVRNVRLRGAAADPATHARMVELYRRRGYGPERVAKNVLRAVQRNRLVAPISPEAWALYYLKRLSPRLLRWFGRVMSQRQLRAASTR